jgi:hypothetical protein
MPATPNEHEIASDAEAHATLGFCSPERLNAASLVFIACAGCARVLTLAGSVSSVTGTRVCWDCGVLSLEGSRP